jgi:hypothetical protein
MRVRSTLLHALPEFTKARRSPMFAVFVGNRCAIQIAVTGRKEDDA